LADPSDVDAAQSAAVRELPADSLPSRLVRHLRAQDQFAKTLRDGADQLARQDGEEVTRGVSCSTRNSAITRLGGL
jgi:hypothetical protein